MQFLKKYYLNYKKYFFYLLGLLFIKYFCFQFLIVQTNSMVPILNGLNLKVYNKNIKNPSFYKKVLRYCLLGAKYKKIKSTLSGEIKIPITLNGQFIIKNKFNIYSYFNYKPLIMYINNQKFIIYINKFINIENIFVDTFFSLFANLKKELLIHASYNNMIEMYDNKLFLKTNTLIKKGKNIFICDIIIGDIVVVNKLYMFFKKLQLGDIIIFLQNEDYLIKRIIGLNKDLLRINYPLLYINKIPINSKNQQYNIEYFEFGQLWGGKTVKVPYNFLYCLGDNSLISIDSRFFGPLNQKNIIGKAFFIIYPFTSRWGFIN